VEILSFGTLRKMRISVGFLDKTYGQARADGDKISYEGPKAGLVKQLVEARLRRNPQLKGKELLLDYLKGPRSYIWAAIEEE
jgi:hypothetical protein